MKIVCESCGAKYSIADEKVAGKVFKIRCKKCSAVIVVKGDSPEGDESTRVYDYGGEAIWHVVVGGEQQGPFAPRQIGELLADGKIDWEAYVWREGMDGWQPAKDVEPLVSAVMADSDGAKAPKAAPAYGSGQVFGGTSDMGADPFAAADDGGLGSVIAQQGKSSAGVGDDLFAKSARSPFSGAAEEEERGSSGRISSARVSGAEALTGQRNENSVLFSLSNLQALATGSGGAPVSVGVRPGMAQGEGSGLIDIRALASATQAVADRPNGSAREKVEDLLAVGSGSAGFSAANFAAPVAAEKADTSKLLVGGMIAAFVAILGLGGAVAYLVMREPPAAQPGVVAAAEPGAPSAGQPSAPAAQAAGTPTAEAEKQPEPSGSTGRSDDDSHEAKEARSSGSSGSHGGAPKKRETGKAEKETPASAPAAAPAPTPAPAAPKKSSGDQSIDDLLSGALGSNKGGSAPKPAAPKPAASDLPSAPGRDDVLSALKAVAPKVSACGNGQSGIATAKIGVAGSTGRVTSVDVSGQFAGTPVAACVTREVGKAKFPKFSQPSFSVTFPFKI
jgi:predicted Zn finger-like uncharacterized protein